MLYKPQKKSKKFVIHVHGINDNFYNNPFIINLAEMYTSHGYNFLTFNNRGHEVINELIKYDSKPKIILGGSAYESFNESFYDIEGAINYTKAEEIIIEGHSYGTNKIINYIQTSKNNKIRGIILISPCDVNYNLKLQLGENYDKIQIFAKKLCDAGKELTLLESVLYPLTFSAKTFVNDWHENSLSNIFRYSDKNYVNEKLKAINIPILVEIGSKDKMITNPTRDIENFFNNNFKNCKINYIENASHNYFGYANTLAEDIESYIINFD